jgi:hypothetical protein
MCQTPMTGRKVVHPSTDLNNFFFFLLLLLLLLLLLIGSLSVRQ